MYYIGQVISYEVNIDYIIENYCINKDKPKLQCNGKCHLAKQLQVVSANNDNTEIVISIGDSFYPIFYNTQQIVEFKKASFLRNLTPVSFYNKNYTFNFISKHFKPPIV